MQILNKTCNRHALYSQPTMQSPGANTEMQYHAYFTFSTFKFLSLANSFRNTEKLLSTAAIVG